MGILVERERKWPRRWRMLCSVGKVRHTGTGSIARNTISESLHILKIPISQEIDIRDANVR